MFIDFIFLIFYLLFRERGREGERGEKHWWVRETSTGCEATLAHPQLGTWPATQACAPATFWFTGWISTHWAAPARTIIDVRERGRNIDVSEKHWLVTSCMCPDQGWNLQLFGAQDNAPTNRDTQPGLTSLPSVPNNVPWYGHSTFCLFIH